MRQSPAARPAAHPAPTSRPIGPSSCDGRFSDLWRWAAACRVLAAAVACGMMCAAAGAQTAPEEDPQLTDPSWRDQPAPQPPSGDLEAPESAAATAPDYRIRRAPLLPEGSFLPRRRGTMLRSGSGEWVFVFHPDERGEAEAPMTLLPSAAMERMEETLARRGERPQFILTGQVFVYERRNYLLPMAFSMASPVAAAAEGDASAPVEREAPGADDRAEPGETEGTSRSELDAAVEDLIRQIESERPGERALGESSMLADITRRSDRGEDDTLARPRPDGALLVRQRGRLTRQSGAWRLTIDNDGDTAANFQTTMVLLPCLNLERMEALAADRGENQSFEVSGMVLQYRGRNFLVPTIYRVAIDGDVRPLQ